MKNEILHEVWRNRDEFAREYKHDIKAMVAALQEMEKHPLTGTVDRRGQTPVGPAGHKQKNTGRRGRR
jgi:N-methylhydantoinase B/oxoprolinase/acetone carboxylase alpha subunit